MSLKKALGFGAPSIVNVASRLISVPITTYYLGPEDFGQFAIVLGFVALFLAITSSFSSYVVSHRYRQASDPESASAVFTCVVVEMAMAVAGAVAMVLIWPSFGPWAGMTTQLPAACISLAAIAIPIATLWQSVAMVVIYEGHARTFAYSYSLSAVVQVVATTLTLYFGLGLLALFIGYTAGVAVTAVFALPTVVRLRRAGLCKSVVGDMRSMAWLAVASNFAEAAFSSIERIALLRLANMEVLGIYYHSLNYRHVLLSVVKAVSLAGHRTTIDEARADSGVFAWTRQAWALMYGVLMVVGVGAAFLGQEIVALLTHDKFTEAAPLIPLWCFVLVVQQAARPQQYKMMASGLANRLSSYKLISIVVGIGSLAITIPFIGMYGPVLSLLLKESIHRSMIYLHAARAWRIPFSDWLGIVACMVISISTWISIKLADEFESRLAIWIILSIVLLAYIMHIVRKMAASD